MNLTAIISFTWFSQSVYLRLAVFTNAPLFHRSRVQQAAISIEHLISS